MNAVFSLSTPRFDEVDKSPNPSSPERGRALLVWLVERLTELGRVRDARVEAENVGWYVDVAVFGEPYRIAAGSSAGADCAAATATQWTLSVSARRSIIDRLLGRRELTADNALLRIVLEILERQPDFTTVDLIVE